MKIKRNHLEFIEIKKFSGSFSVVADIFDVLKFSNSVIAWKMSDKDLILFTEAEWNWFIF